MRIKSLKELEKKSWYRLLKVIYIGAVAIGLGLTIIISAAGEVIPFFIWGTIIVLFLAWIIRGSFFYIVTGDFNLRREDKKSNSKKIEIKESIVSKPIEPSKIIENTPFSSNKNLVKAVLALAVINIILVLIAIATNSGLLLSAPWTEVLLEIISDPLFETVWSLSIFLYFFFYLAWIKRSYRNLWSFSQKTFTTPGWSVGNYLVPIVNLIEPYRNMKEMWRGTTKSEDFKYIKTWWAVWIIALIATLYYRGTNVEILIEEGKIREALGTEIFVNTIRFLNLLLTIIIIYFITLSQELRNKKIVNKPNGIYQAFIMCFLAFIGVALIGSYAIAKYEKQCDTVNGWKDSSGECHCNISYELDPSTGTCIKKEEVLTKSTSTQTCPENSRYVAGECQCNFGYTWDQINKKCISENEICLKEFGANTYGYDGSCYCKDGYDWNAGKTKCIQTASIKITSHNRYSTFGSDPIFVEGTTSENCSKIVVTASNSFNTINDTYTLQQYSYGNTTFRYRVSRADDNLAFGDNNYMFTAYCDNDQIKQQEIIIKYTQLDPSIKRPIFESYYYKTE